MSLPKQNINICWDEIKRLKLYKTFVVGAVAGFWSSFVANPNLHNISQHLAYSYFFALWSNILITGDKAMDCKQLDKETSLSLLTRILLAILGYTESSKLVNLPSYIFAEYKAVFGVELNHTDKSLYYPEKEGFKFENYAIKAGIELGRNLQHLRAQHKKHNIESVFDEQLIKFSQRSINMAFGQLNSLYQKMLKSALRANL